MFSVKVLMSLTGCEGSDGKSPSSYLKATDLDVAASLPHTKALTPFWFTHLTVTGTGTSLQ